MNINEVIGFTTRNYTQICHCCGVKQTRNTIEKHTEKTSIQRRRAYKEGEHTKKTSIQRRRAYKEDEQFGLFEVPCHCDLARLRVNSEKGRCVVVADYVVAQSFEWTLWVKCKMVITQNLTLCFLVFTNSKFKEDVVSHQHPGQ